MGDIYCRVNGCGEPWELDSLHGWIEENHDPSEWRTKGNYDQKKYDKFWQEARAKFKAEGCAMFGTQHNTESPNPQAAELMGIAEGVMGDDVDGIVSMLEDAEVMGLMRRGGNMD